MGDPARRIHHLPAQGGGDRPTGAPSRGPPCVLSRGELASLLRALASPENASGVRDVAMASWAYWTACRASELVSMTYADLDRARHRVTFYRQKVKDRHEVPVPEVGWGALDRWLLASGMAGRREGLLFPVSTVTFWRRLKMAGGWAGIPLRKCRPHVLRHTRASLLLGDGASVEAVRLLLGHASLVTTTRYLSVAEGWLDSQMGLGAI